MVSRDERELQRAQRSWDRFAAGYDRQMTFMDRRFFGDTRAWVCGQAHGKVLEVAIGTGLNLAHYADDVRLTGIDLSPKMLEQARTRAKTAGREVTLSTGNAQRLDFPDDSFDSVVCTFSMCAVPNDRQAVAEMRRVLRPGGLLLLADHVVSTSAPARWTQCLLDQLTVPAAGEHFRRRPYLYVRAEGLEIERHERFKLGIVERLAARHP